MLTIALILTMQVAPNVLPRKAYPALYDAFRSEHASDLDQVIVVGSIEFARNHGRWPNLETKESN